MTNNEKYSKVVIRQLNARGRTAREFTSIVLSSEVDEKIRRTEMAYNMAHTIIIVDGILVR